MDNYTSRPHLQQTPRINYIDKTKGLAMLCIIAGHMGSSLINSIVFTFHVPIFFIICGLFFKVEIKKVFENAKKLFKTYAFTLIFLLILDILKQSFRMILSGSFILSNIWHMMVDYATTGLFCYDIETEILGISVRSVGAIWFYIALIWAFLFSFIILRISEKISKNFKIRIVASCGLSVLLWLLAYLTTDIFMLPAVIQPGACAAIFLITGYHLKNVFLKNDQIGLHILTLIFFAAALYFSIAGKHMSLARNFYPNPVINILGAISAAFLILSFFRKFSCHIVGKALEIFGRYSMIVLSFHYIEKNLINWDKLTGYFGGGLMINAAAFLVKVLWCCLGIFLARNISPLKWVYSIKK